MLFAGIAIDALGQLVRSQLTSHVASVSGLISGRTSNPHPLTRRGFFVGWDNPRIIYRQKRETTRRKTGVETMIMSVESLLVTISRGVHQHLNT